MDKTEAEIPRRSRPLVSVVIPTFNRRDYLRIALKSALDQTYRDLEIVVQDNASVIDPKDVVTSFGDSRIRYYRNVTNVGQTANVVSACARARGKYVAILGDDDIWHPDFLSILLRPLEADDSLTVAFCDHEIIDPAGRDDHALTDRVTRRWLRHLLHEGVYRPFDDIALVNRSICVFSAAVLRRKDISWQAIPLKLRFGVDLYLAYLAARTGKGCYYVPVRLAQYRYHPSSAGSSLNQADNRIANARDAMLYWGEFLRDEKLSRNKRYFEMKLGFNVLVIVTSLLRGGDCRQALDLLRRSWIEGLVPPRILLYLLIYALRLHRATA